MTLPEPWPSIVAEFRQSLPEILEGRDPMVRGGYADYTADLQRKYLYAPRGMKKRRWDEPGAAVAEKLSREVGGAR